MKRMSKSGFLVTMVLLLALSMAFLLCPSLALASASWSQVGGSSGLTGNASDVNCLLSAGGTIYAGTYFGGVWAWNGSSWSEVGGASGPKADEVMGLASANGNIYAAGNYVWAWNGTTWTQLSCPFWTTVYSLASDASGTIYAGTWGQGVWALSGSSWAEVGGNEGLAEVGGASGLTGAAYVYSLLDANGVIYAGTNAGVWAWNGFSWSQVGGASGLSVGNAAYVYSLLSAGGTIYAGTGQGVWAWNGSSWSQVGDGCDSSGASGKDIAQSLASANNTIYAGTQNDGVWAWSTQVAPTITSAASATFNIGTAGSFTVTTTGTPTPSLTETGSLPTGVTFTDNGNGTATLAGTPAAGDEGNYWPTITASNGVSPDATQSFGLMVSPQIGSLTNFNPTSSHAGTAQTVTVQVVPVNDYAPNSSPATANLLDSSGKVQATASSTFMSGNAWISLDVPASLPAGQYTVQVVAPCATNSPYTVGTYTINSGGTGRGSEIIIPTDGGTVTSSDGQASVTIPPGAIQSTSDVTVAITLVTNPTPPAGYLFLGSVYDFTVNGGGASFAHPVTISIAVPAGDSSSGLVVYRNDGSGWTPVTQGVTISGNTVTVSVSNFTEYGLADRTSSGGVESFPILSAAPSYFENLK